MLVCGYRKVIQVCVVMSLVVHVTPLQRYHPLCLVNISLSEDGDVQDRPHNGL